VTEVESCWRCGEDMRWVHGTWQCPRCRFKLGCCEGDVGEAACLPHETPAQARPPLARNPSGTGGAWRCRASWC